MYTFLKSFKIFDIYHPNIKYTYNWDAINYFGKNIQREIDDKNELEIDLLFQYDGIAK